MGCLLSPKEESTSTYQRFFGVAQELDVAVIKATTSQYHVVPKEKHVRSRAFPSCSCLPSGTGLLVLVTQQLSCVGAALKGAVHVSRSRQDVSHVKMELLKRLRKATDWLVRLNRLLAHCAPAEPQAMRNKLDPFMVRGSAWEVLAETPL